MTITRWTRQFCSDPDYPIFASQLDKLFFIRFSIGHFLSLPPEDLQEMYLKDSIAPQKPWISSYFDKEIPLWMAKNPSRSVKIGQNCVKTGWFFSALGSKIGENLCSSNEFLENLDQFQWYFSLKTPKNSRFQPVFFMQLTINSAVFHHPSQVL